MKKGTSKLPFYFLLGLFFVVIILFSTTAQSGNDMIYGSTWDKTCSDNMCQTTIYSYEKYWFDSQSGIWGEIDESWHECGNDLCTNEYYFKAVAQSDGTITAHLNNEESTFKLSSFSNQNLRFNPSIHGNILLYEDVIPNYIDLRYQYLPRKLKEEIIIKRPLPNLPLQNFDIIFTKSGDASFTMSESTICDYNDVCQVIESSVQNNQISLTIPVDFLTNETTIYPVIIDPTFSLGDINWNGGVKEDNSPETEGVTYTRTSNPSERIGNLKPGVNRRADIDWDVSAMSDSANISRVVLTIFSEENIGTGENVRIYEMEKNSSEYADQIGNCQGNCHFYEDMGNGTVYGSYTFHGSAGPTFMNFTFSQQGREALQNALASDVFSTGIKSLEDSGKNLTISLKDDSNATRRPKLVINHSYESYDLSYDSNGNLIQGFGKKLAYNSFNKLIQVNDSTTNEIIAEYTYDHEGNRITKVEYGVDDNENNLTTYYIDESFIQERNTNGTILNYTYYNGVGKLLASKLPNGDIEYYHPDHLGSSTLITNESGNKVDYVSYLPFGGIHSGDADDRFLYTGQEKDKGTEFYDYGARQYYPKFRHFLQPDPTIPDIYNPQYLNHYSYVLNNPYKYVDESGNVAVEVGPSFSSTLTIPGTPLGITLQVGGGRVFAYNPTNREFQAGTYASFGGGAGASAIGEKLSLNLISIYPEANSLKDLEGSGTNFGFSGGDTITAGFEGELRNKNSNDNPPISNPAITLGVGAGAEAHIQKTTTITSGPQNPKDVLLGGKTSLPRFIYESLNKESTKSNNLNQMSNRNNQQTNINSNKNKEWKSRRIYRWFSRPYRRR